MIWNGEHEPVITSRVHCNSVAALVSQSQGQYQRAGLCQTAKNLSGASTIKKIVIKLCKLYFVCIQNT